jgi:O-succinylbenzoate synthase
VKIEPLSFHPYESTLSNGMTRKGAFINIGESWGECSPFPGLSQESLQEALTDLKDKEPRILAQEWSSENIFAAIESLKLLPSASFALESALLPLVTPLSPHLVPSSALLMGKPDQILEQAKLREREGFKTAKLKVGNLDFNEAHQIINQLKDRFKLRIDVNRAWGVAESLRFFEAYPIDTFDYVEEPFDDPQQLKHFPHPLAIDESFRSLQTLPTLKALIYKPTVYGGLSLCRHLVQWTRDRGIQFVLSSSFETDLGLASIAVMAQRLALEHAIGIGTYHFLKTSFCDPTLTFQDSYVSATPLKLKR